MSFYSYTNKELWLNHQIEQQLQEIKVIDDHIIALFETKCAIFSLVNYCLEKIINLNASKYKQVLFVSASKILVTRNEGIFEIDLITGATIELLNLKTQYLTFQRFFQYFFLFDKSKIVLYYIRKNEPESFCYSILPEKKILKKKLKVQRMNFEKFNQVSKMVIYPEDYLDKEVQKIVKFDIYDSATLEIQKFQIAFSIGTKFIIMFVKEYTATQFAIGLNIVEKQSVSSILIYNIQKKIITYVFNYTTLIEKFFDLNVEKRTLRIQERQKGNKKSVKTINIKNGQQMVSLSLENSQNLHVDKLCVFQYVEDKRKKVIKLNLWKPIQKLSCYLHLLSHGKNQNSQPLFHGYSDDLLQHLITLLK